MTSTELQAFTRKELASMARGQQISGWHGMRKEELVRALTRKLRSSGSNGKSGKGRGKSATPATDSRLSASSRTARRRYLSTAELPAGAALPQRDRFTASALDSHWIRADWVLSSRLIDRARAALGAAWHSAVPVIRVLDLSSGDSLSSTSSLAGEHELRSASQTSYLPIEHPDRTYMLQLAYRAGSGEMFVLARSNRVKVPAPGAVPAEQPLEPRAENEVSGCRLPRPGRRGAEDDGEDFRFQLQAELVVHGVTEPGAELTLLGNPVRLNEDGSFRVQLSLEEGRQVIPAVVTTPDGSERRTIVLAVERNTRELEPQSLDDAAS